MQRVLKKLVVFPNDPIWAYYEKGEIKERYFNPGNLFEEVYLFTFGDREIEPYKVQEIAGEAQLNIRPLGKLSLRGVLTLPLLRKSILQKISEIPIVQIYRGTH